MEVCVYHALDSINEINRKMPEVTLRDLFAMNAMNGIMNDNMRTSVDDILRKDDENQDFLTERIAEASYKLADAMIQARKKKN